MKKFFLFNLINMLLKLTIFNVNSSTTSLKKQTGIQIDANLNTVI